MFGLGLGKEPTKRGGESGKEYGISTLTLTSKWGQSLKLLIKRDGRSLRGTSGKLWKI